MTESACAKITFFFSGLFLHETVKPPRKYYESAASSGKEIHLYSLTMMLLMNMKEVLANIF